MCTEIIRGVMVPAAPVEHDSIISKIPNLIRDAPLMIQCSSTDKFVVIYKI